jgi:hypothetical protein
MSRLVFTFQYPLGIHDAPVYTIDYINFLDFTNFCV